MERIFRVDASGDFKVVLLTYFVSIRMYPPEKYVRLLRKEKKIGRWLDNINQKLHQIQGQGMKVMSKHFNLIPNLLRHGSLFKLT